MFTDKYFLHVCVRGELIHNSEQMEQMKDVISLYVIIIIYMHNIDFKSYLCKLFFI